jgi:hypothetical protein
MDTEDRPPAHDASGRTMERRAFGDPALQAELERRLALIEAPDFEDPAREDFTAADFIAIAVLVVVLSVGFLVWGY